MHAAGSGPKVNYWAEEMEMMYRERQGKQPIFGDTPLYVLAAGRASSDPERLREVNDMVLMSSNSLLLLDPKSVHDMHIEVPSIVTQSIVDVVGAVRTGSRLDVHDPCTHAVTSATRK
jgi:hypothetical protein